MRVNASYIFLVIHNIVLTTLDLIQLLESYKMLVSKGEQL